MLANALAEDPADRFASAGEFVRMLTEAETEVEKRASRVSRTRAAVIAGAFIAAGAAGVVYATSAGGGSGAVEQNTYAVFPFRHVGAAQSMWLDGDGCARLLHDAMARWQGVHLVDDMRVSDVWTRQQPRTVPEAFAAAKTLRAGQLAWGEVVGVGDSLEIRVVAYDIARGANATRQFVVRLARDAPQLDSVFSALADSIIIGGRRIREGAATGTKNLHALEKFLDGRAAMDRFDLRLAEQGFKDALAADDSYAHAHFWLARTMAWEGEAEPSAWSGNAARAVALSAALPPRDQAHASALLDLAEGRMAEACQRYRTLIASDSLDFAAWYGLGDCNARDPVVVRDARSPSGYRFRGSMHTAIASYRHALALVPSFHVAERGLAFGRLSHRVLYTEEARPRRGVAVAPDTQRFAAFPSFAANTLAFVPLPYATAINPSSRPATERQGGDMGRGDLSAVDRRVGARVPVEHRRAGEPCARARIGKRHCRLGGGNDRGARRSAQFPQGHCASDGSGAPRSDDRAPAAQGGQHTRGARACRLGASGVAIPNTGSGGISRRARGIDGTRGARGGLEQTRGIGQRTCSLRGTEWKTGNASHGSHRGSTGATGVRGDGRSARQLACNARSYVASHHHMDSGGGAGGGTTGDLSQHIRVGVRSARAVGAIHRCTGS